MLFWLLRHMAGIEDNIKVSFPHKDIVQWLSLEVTFLFGDKMDVVGWN